MARVFARFVLENQAIAPCDACRRGARWFGAATKVKETFAFGWKWRKVNER
ncbi:MAG: hypothetical protein AAF676_11720 [Pseudomonadota bacterium]